MTDRDTGTFRGFARGDPDGAEGRGAITLSAAENFARSLTVTKPARKRTVNSVTAPSAPTAITVVPKPLVEIAAPFG